MTPESRHPLALLDDLIATQDRWIEMQSNVREDAATVEALKELLSDLRPIAKALRAQAEADGARWRVTELPPSRGSWTVQDSFEPGIYLLSRATTTNFGGPSNPELIGMLYDPECADLAALAPALLHDLRLARGYDCHCTRCTTVAAALAQAGGTP